MKDIHSKETELSSSPPVGLRICRPVFKLDCTFSSVWIAGIGKMESSSHRQFSSMCHYRMLRYSVAFRGIDVFSKKASEVMVSVFMIQNKRWGIIRSDFEIIKPTNAQNNVWSTTWLCSIHSQVRHQVGGSAVPQKGHESTLPLKNCDKIRSSIGLTGLSWKLSSRAVWGSIIVNTVWALFIGLTESHYL